MYTGKIIDKDGVRDYDRVVTNGYGKVLDLGTSLKVVNHSPTGFCWGYYGSGPAQLALAILLDYYDGDVETAKALYQDFKSKVIAGLPMDEDFVLTGKQVEDALTMINIERMRNDE